MGMAVPLLSRDLSERRNDASSSDEDHLNAVRFVGKSTRTFKQTVKAGGIRVLSSRRCEYSCLEWLRIVMLGNVARHDCLAWLGVVYGGLVCEYGRRASVARHR